MCGRYFIDAEMWREIKKICKQIDDSKLKVTQGDVRPTDMAVVLTGMGEVHPEHMCWGFMSKYQEGLLINARAETVLDKPSFSNGIWYHRIVIPASGFYEWNRLREKNTFTRSDASVLYLAGFCDWFDNERRFVILTTAANESMLKVHDRMPLILEKEQLEDWFDNEKMQVILRQEPVMLKRQAEYEQLSLFS